MGLKNSFAQKVARKVYSQVTIRSSSSESEDDENYGSDIEVDGEVNVKHKSRVSKSLAELIEPLSTELPLDKEMKRLEYLTCFVGCGTRRIPFSFRLIGLVVYLQNLLCHFAFEIYEALTVYEYMFILSQGIWFLTYIALTLGMRFQTVPWLQNALQEVRRLEVYEKSITKIVIFQRKFLKVFITFGFVVSAIQHGLLYIDGALNLDFNQSVSENVYYILHAARFFSGLHMYAAYALFWLVPTTVMLLAGYVMEEFLDQTSAKMRDRKNVFTFKEALSSYTARMKFVRQASAKTTVTLAILMGTSFICFGVNAYAFLFRGRRYLHVLHSLLPLAVMIYPLCAAAWATKQYTSFIIVVVKAWIQRDDLDDSSSDDSGVEDLQQSHSKKMLHAKLKSLGFLKKKNNSPKIAPKHQNKLKPNDMSLNFETSEIAGDKPFDRSSGKSLNMSLVQEATIQASGDEISRPRSSSPVLSPTAICAIGKFKKASAIKPRFNFEKFLAYLESMRGEVGFEIAGFMITWDKVSTTLFFMLSIVAAFLQNSIFGSKHSTLVS